MAPGRVVDPRGDQMRAIGGKRGLHELFEVLGVVSPSTFGEATSAGDGDKVGAVMCRCLLTTRDLIGAVVHDQQSQVLTRTLRDRREATELHEQRTVALDGDDTSLRLRKRQAERNGKASPMLPSM